MIEGLVALFRGVIALVAVLCGVAILAVLYAAFVAGTVRPGEALIGVGGVLVGLAMAVGIGAVLLRISDQLGVANGHLQRLAEVGDTPQAAGAARLSPGVGDVIKLYRGREIRKAETGVTVDGQVFSGILAAERHIDGA